MSRAELDIGLTGHHVSRVDPEDPETPFWMYVPHDDVVWRMIQPEWPFPEDDRFVEMPLKNFLKATSTKSTKKHFRKPKQIVVRNEKRPLKNKRY